LDDLLSKVTGVASSKPVNTSVKRKRTKKETPNEVWNRNNREAQSPLGIVPYYRQSDPEDDLPPSYFKRAPPDPDSEDAHTLMFSKRLMTDVDRKRKAYDEKDEGGGRKRVKKTTTNSDEDAEMNTTDTVAVKDSTKRKKGESKSKKRNGPTVPNKNKTVVSKIETCSDTNSNIDSELDLFDNVDWSAVHTGEWAQSLQKAIKELAQDMKNARRVWVESGEVPQC